MARRTPSWSTTLGTSAALLGLVLALAGWGRMQLGPPEDPIRAFSQGLQQIEIQLEEEALRYLWAPVR